MNKRSLSGMMPVGNGETELYYEYSEPSAAGSITVVFLHAHSVDQRMWEPQIEVFGREYPLLRYDLRGYGQSSLPQEGEDYLHAADLLQLLDSLKIEAVHLVGLSLGAFVALDCLALAPERVRSVVVASAGFPDPRVEGTAPFVGDINVLKREWYEGLLTHCGPDTNGYRQELWRMIMDWKAWQPTHHEPECLLRGRLPALLHEAVPVPVCAVWGERDSAGAKASLRLLLNHLPHATAVKLSTAGHFCNMEVPEAFNHELHTFWERVDSDPRSSLNP